MCIRDSCNTEVLQSEAFLNATPYNPAFAETMTFVKDFWNIPEFGSLLDCLLYTSDAADERSSVDLGGRRIIKKTQTKKKKNKKKQKTIQHHTQWSSDQQQDWDRHANTTNVVKQ